MGSKFKNQIIPIILGSATLVGFFITLFSTTPKSILANVCMWSASFLSNNKCTMLINGALENRFNFLNILFGTMSTAFMSIIILILVLNSRLFSMTTIIAYPSRLAARQEMYNNLLGAREVFLLGISNDIIHDAGSEFWSSIQNNRTNILIVYPKPKTTEIKTRELHENYQIGQLSGRIYTHYKQFIDLANQNLPEEYFKSCVKVKFLQHYPTQSVMLIDDHAVYVSPYFYGMRGRDSPVFVATSSSDIGKVIISSYRKMFSKISEQSE